jgi:capsular exopolysaccharide synthesis family protein
MTTLPQTTPLRLPRPSAPAQLSIPGPIGPGMAAQAATGSQMSGADAWRVLRSHAWLIIIMLILSAGAGYGINTYLKMYYSKYTATGVIQVQAPPSMDILSGQQQGDGNPLNTTLKTTAILLHDPTLFTKVLQNPNSEIRNTQWFLHFASPQLAKADLIDSFMIVPQADTNLLSVSMTYSDPKSYKVIIESVVNQHIQEQQAINHDKQYNHSLQLHNAKIAYEIKVKELRDAIADLESKLNMSGVTGTNNRISAKDIELSQLVSDTLKVKLDAGNAQDDYNNIVAQINADQDPPKVAEMLYNDPEIAGYRNQISQIDMAIAEDLDHLGPEHPVIRDLTLRKQLLDKRMNTATADARIRLRTAVAEESHNRVIASQRQLDVMGKRVDALNNDMADLSNLLASCLSKQGEVSGYEAKLKQISDQLDQIATFAVKQDFSGVEWASHPEQPEIPSFPKLQLTMAMSIAAGLGLALGIAFLRELMDTTIRSPRDISRVGNMNLLGMVPHEDDDPQSAGSRLPMVIFEAPHSMMAEQLRQVRTRLQHSSSLDTTRSILITSPSPGDGKSTIACNLASGLALNGRRILLVDANFRRPELHRVFNLANDQGFSDVLNSLDIFEHAVQETQVPNLFVLPSGPKPTNATELLESQLLIDFIERALEEFDHVIFDSGPLLFVSETVALAPRVDGVVSVVRARTNSRGVLTRMKETLRQIKAEHLGVVLNAVRAQGGGYYGRNIRTYYEYQNGGGRAA